MNSEKLSELQRLFDLACKVPPVEQHALLKNESGGDEALFQSVVELLNADSKSGNLLDDQLTLAEFLQPSMPATGTYVGSYQLLERIGSGGMGLVFLAQQDSPIQRKVALKVVRDGGFNQDAISRYETEKQALAKFDHPSLTKIFDAGISAEGQLFFVMEYVDGQSLTEYCDCNRVPVDKRLRMFGMVCDAIHHAHQHGFVHRDIKPSNILVTTSGSKAVPKLIDFGIAKVLQQNEFADANQLTRPGFLVGTPTYMSPEQADVNAESVDARSDIYSLGVVLYELMTGRTPFDESKSHLELLKNFESKRDSDFDTPYERVRKTTTPNLEDEIFENRDTSRTQLMRFLKSDISAIIFKAMEGDPSERYSTAAQLKEELDLFLAGKPVQASAPGVATRVRKWLNRNQAIAMFAATTCVIVAAAISLSYVMMSRASTARENYSALERNAEQLRLHANQFQKNQVAIERASHVFFKSQMGGFGFPTGGPFAGRPSEGGPEIDLMIEMMTKQMGIDTILNQRRFSEGEPPLPLVDFWFFNQIEAEATQFKVLGAGFLDFLIPGKFVPSSVEPINQTITFCNCLLTEQEKQFVNPTLFLSDTHDVLAQLYLKLDRADDAMAALDRSAEIRESVDMKRQTNRTVLHKMLRFQSFKLKGDLESAKRVRQEIDSGLSSLTDPTAIRDLRKLDAEFDRKR